MFDTSVSKIQRGKFSHGIFNPLNLYSTKIRNGLMWPNVNMAIYDHIKLSNVGTQVT